MLLYKSECSGTGQEFPSEGVEQKQIRSGKCFNCGKPGHITMNCYRNRKGTGAEATGRNSPSNSKVLCTVAEMTDQQL